LPGRAAGNEVRRRAVLRDLVLVACNAIEQHISMFNEVIQIWSINYCYKVAYE
jgi:hypothetical protein